MVKVIKNSVEDEGYPKRVECSNCGSSLEYEKADILYEDYGIGYLKCPVCGEEFILWDEDSIDEDIDHVNFPQYFGYSENDGGYILPNEAINSYIRECVNELRKDRRLHIAYVQVGGVFIFVIDCRDDKMYDVVVTKDFYDMTYSYSTEDYANE